jgi:tRNA(Ile)-lysidine synthase
VLKQFISHLSRKFNIEAPASVLLAVSGGLDSMVMLELFHQAGFSVGVAHVNFQLRGEASDGDEALVKIACASKGIPFFVQRFSTLDYAQTHGISIQMAARELRYNWFSTLAETHHYSWIATAHHLNDSIETVLFNWTNAASLAGLSGIAEKHGKIIRPLLFATRKQLEEFATESGIVWREDNSNQSDNYKRNFIRHQVVPPLTTLNPSLEESFKRGQRKLQGELSFLQQAFHQWKSQYVSEENKLIHIDKKGFDVLHEAAIILYKVVEAYGFNFDVCETIMQSMHAQPGKKFLSATHQLTIDRTSLIINPKMTEIGEVLIESGDTDVYLGNWHLKLEVSKHQKPVNDPNVAMLDISTLQFPLHWRRWQAGDAFYPLGMKGKKKVSDLLIDSKLSLAEKANVTVLLSRDAIVWVAGHRIDDRHKLTDHTQSVLKLTLLPYFN